MTALGQTCREGVEPRLCRANLQREVLREDQNPPLRRPGKRNREVEAPTRLSSIRSRLRRVRPPFRSRLHQGRVPFRWTSRLRGRQSSLLAKEGRVSAVDHARSTEQGYVEARDTARSRKPDPEREMQPRTDRVVPARSVHDDQAVSREPDDSTVMLNWISEAAVAVVAMRLRRRDRLAVCPRGLEAGKPREWSAYGFTGRCRPPRRCCARRYRGSGSATVTCRRSCQGRRRPVVHSPRR